MKTLIIYYSQARENTRRIAEMTQKSAGADIIEIAGTLLTQLLRLTDLEEK